MDIDVLKGKTITKCYQNNDGDELIFECSDGSIYKQYHEQDCCESVSIEDICGDLNDLVGQVIRDAFESSSAGESNYGSSTWTFYTIVTMQSAVTIRWYGESNGYYSESVNFVCVHEAGYKHPDQPSIYL
jgi:hypothetical protein